MAFREFTEKSDKPFEYLITGLTICGDIAVRDIKYHQMWNGISVAKNDGNHFNDLTHTRTRAPLAPQSTIENRLIQFLLNVNACKIAFETLNI